MSTENKLSESARLKLIEKQEFYSSEQRVYGFGFYDGYMEAKKELQKTKINTNVIEFLKNEWDWGKGDTGMFDFNGIAGILTEYSKGLQHHYDITIGLFATDRPDLIQDPENVMFEIKP